MSTFSQAITIPMNNGGHQHHFSHYQNVDSNGFTSPISVPSPFSTSSNMTTQTQTQTQLFDSSSQASSSFTSSSLISSGISPSTISENNNNIATTSGTKDDESLKKLKPHKCEICGSCFARKVHLQRHSLRHQNGKPYCCDLCGKCFSRQDSLVRHHRLLHDNIPIEGGNNGKLGQSSSGKGNLATKKTISNLKSNKKKLSISTSSKKVSKKSSIPQACVRCNSINVQCDGKQPCSRCIQSGHQQEDGATSCCYAPSSAPITIGQATRVRQRNDSIATSTSSMASMPSMVEDDESSTTVSESPSWATNQNGFCHGPRSESSNSISFSNVAEMNGWSTFQPMTFNQTQSAAAPHPFELPQLVEFDLKAFDNQMNAILSPNQFPLQQQQPQPQQQFQFQQPQNALFDWCSFVMSQQQQNPSWLSESASNKDLNETLLGGDLHIAALSQDQTSNSWDGLMRSLSNSSHSSQQHFHQQFTQQQQQQGNNYEILMA